MQSEIEKLRIYYKKELPKIEFQKYSFNVSEEERKERVNNVLINKDSSEFISDIYDCVICFGLCYQPMNCQECSVICCEQCYKQMKKVNPRSKCPKCRSQQEFTKANRNILKLRGNIKVECIKKDCQHFNQTMRLEDYEKHIDSCVQRVYYCPLLCGTQIKSKIEAENHFNLCITNNMSLQQKIDYVLKSEPSIDKESKQFKSWQSQPKLTVEDFKKNNSTEFNLNEKLTIVKEIEGEFAVIQGQIHMKQNKPYGIVRYIESNRNYMIEVQLIDNINGFGRVFYSDGYYNDQNQWIDDLNFPAGSFYIGEFKNGIRHGQGTMYDQQGQIQQQGLWDNNIFRNA